MNPLFENWCQAYKYSGGTPPEWQNLTAFEQEAWMGLRRTLQFHNTEAGSQRDDSDD